MFESSWHHSQEAPHLKISFIPFKKVFNWYSQFNFRLRQVASTNTEKALFALLHLGRRDFVEPEATLWLASALEAIYDTPIGSAFQFLNNRIATVFILTTKQQADMKKRLREFYDIRNGFAHGGSDVCHPIANETWDSDVDKMRFRNLKMNEFAAVILIGSIQELIRRNIAGLQFEEKISEINFNLQ